MVKFCPNTQHDIRHQPSVQRSLRKHVSTYVETHPYKYDKQERAERAERAYRAERAAAQELAARQLAARQREARLIADALLAFNARASVRVVHVFYKARCTARTQEQWDEHNRQHEWYKEFLHSTDPERAVMEFLMRIAFSLQFYSGQMDTGHWMYLSKLAALIDASWQSLSPGTRSMFSRTDLQLLDQCVIYDAQRLRREAREVERLARLLDNQTVRREILNHRYQRYQRAHAASGGRVPRY